MNLSLVFELVVRATAQQGNFCKDACNIFDSIIMFVCILTLIIFLSAPAIQRDTEVLATVVLAIRYVVVLVRTVHLLAVLKKRRTEVDSMSNNVDFSLLDNSYEAGRRDSFGDFGLTVPGYPPSSSILLGESIGADVFLTTLNMIRRCSSQKINLSCM